MYLVEFRSREITMEARIGQEGIKRGGRLYVSSFAPFAPPVRNYTKRVALCATRDEYKC